MRTRRAAALLAISPKWQSRLGLIVTGGLAIFLCGVLRYGLGPEIEAGADEQSAATTAASARPAASRRSSAPSGATAARGQTPTGGSNAAAPQRPKFPEVVASVNSDPISYRELAEHCVRYYGEDVLESLVNKYLIALKCRELGVVVTPEEVDAEIKRMAERFKLPVDRWLGLLEAERDISPWQYRHDIIWPTLALRKLATDRLEVGQQELREAYEAEYGPAVKVRLIACQTREEAQRLHQQALDNPERFGDLAKAHSADPYSASMKGLLQPIRRHVSDPVLEKAAFSLRPGEISEVLAIGPQYVFLKCEGVLPDRYAQFPLPHVQAQLVEGIRERKLRDAAGEIFQQLQEEGQVEIIFGDPAKRQEYPTLAARVNGHNILVDELHQQCVQRHGRKVLEGMIHRRLIEQAVAKEGLTITEDELDAEVARAAVAMGKLDAQGRPDVAAWLEIVKREQKISVTLYRYDVVWPSVALRKLAGSQVQVTEEDLQKGFEANYGPRVQCRAIVLSSQRRAQEVWDMARRNPTAEYFGLLAEQYSVEASSRALRGEVPPIARHSGQPLLEQEAFSLRPGELSGIVQVGDKFVILFCEGHTKPMQVAFEEVRDLLWDEILEKKTRAAMTEYFARLKDEARIGNFLVAEKSAEAPRRPSAAPSGFPGMPAPSLRTLPQGDFSPSR